MKVESFASGRSASGTDLAETDSTLRAHDGDARAEWLGVSDRSAPLTGSPSTSVDVVAPGAASAEPEQADAGVQVDDRPRRHELHD